MNPTLRKVFATSALAIGMASGGVVAANAVMDTSTAATSANANASATTSATARPTPPPAPGPNCDDGRDRSQRDAALAKQLGTTVDKLKSAQVAARAAVDAKYGKPDHTKPPTTPPSAAQLAALKARHNLFTTTLATNLGVSNETLKAATMTVEKAHLAAEVKAGHLTQAQADAILKALANGERPPFGPGGPGHGGPGHGGPGYGGPGYGGHGGPGGPGPVGGPGQAGS